MVDTVQGHEAVGGATKRGAPDPSVKLPPAVKAAADRAEALSAQAKNLRESAPPGSNEPLATTVKPPVQPTPPSTVVVGNFDPRNPNPPEPPELRVPPTPPPAPAQPQTPEDWEHQFRSLKGRYERGEEEKRRLQQQLIDTQRLMAQIGSPPPAAPPNGGGGEGSGVRFNVAPPPPGKRVTPKEVAEYGEELMDVVGRRAAEVYEPILGQVLGELQQVRRQLGGVQNTVVYDARVKMYEDLAREVPDWDVINNSPQFAQWLDAMDPISHKTRREFLNIAHNSNLTGQVVDIFRSFMTQAGYQPPEQRFLPPPNGAGNSAPQNNSQSNGRFDLAAYAAPGRPKGGQTETPPEQRYFQAGEITQFYRDKTAGRYAGREAEADALERAMIQAGNEGRIIRK